MDLKNSYLTFALDSKLIICVCNLVNSCLQLEDRGNEFPLSVFTCVNLGQDLKHGGSNNLPLRGTPYPCHFLFYLTCFMETYFSQDGNKKELAGQFLMAVEYLLDN